MVLKSLNVAVSEYFEEMSLYMTWVVAGRAARASRDYMRFAKSFDNE
jgi:hypothetical protein